jgi:O-antigen/teichoic acid export membrane protein
MFIVCLSTTIFSLSIFAFVHYHATHSFVLLILFLHYDPHVLICNNYFKGSSRMGSLGNSKGIFIILHILFHMLEIKVYSIIVSKVFGVTIAIKKKIHCKINVQ